MPLLDPHHQTDDSRPLRQRDALTALARSEILASAECTVALGHIVEVVARTLEIPRVSVWQFDPAGKCLRCVKAHAATGSAVGTVLAVNDYPRYFSHLAADDIIAAADASKDPRTAEFAVGYLDVLGVTSMLDAPIRVGSQLLGVLCHEQVGFVRGWQPDEESFAIAAAGMVALVLQRVERQRIQDQLLRSQATLANAQRIAHLGNWELDVADPNAWENSPQLRWSDEIFRILGYDSATTVASVSAFFQRVPREEHAYVREQMAAVVREAKPFSFEHSIIRPDGTRRFVHEQGDCIVDANTGRITVFHGTLQDVTERKRAQQALARSEADFRQLFAESPLPMWVHDRTTLRFLAVNEAAVRHYGYSQQEFLSSTIEQIRPIEDLPRLRNFQPPDDENSYHAGVWRHRRRDGTLIHVELTVRPLLFQGVAAKLVLAHDVTAKLQAEQALRESENRFRQLTEAVPDMFWLTDATTREVLYVSPAYERIWGRPSENLYRDWMDWFSIVHEDDRARVTDELKNRQLEDAYHIEFRIRRGANEVRIIRAKAFPVRDAEGRMTRVAGLASDITEHRLLERQLQHIQRVESIGTLASGVAHDLNNILAPVMMGVGLLKGPTSPHQRATMLELIEKSAQRGATIVSQLLAFSRQASGERAPLQLRHLLREMAHLIQETFPRQIKLVLDCPKDLWPTTADQTQIHQVLMNLCLNARDAMPRGGTLTLSAANLAEPGPWTQLAAGWKGPHVLLAVTDTGQGIPASIIDRIFDPFFTTKEAGHGTGLGLSTALGIVRSHQGHILVESIVGAGTTFRVFLPAAATDALTPDNERVTTPRGNGELILIVDDEEHVRAALRSLLEFWNYTVIEARDGEDGLRQFNAHRAAIKIVITDLMMPGVGGIEFGRAVRQVAPAIRIILFSGLRDQHASEAAAMADRVVGKPCDGPHLAAIVHELLVAAR